MYPTLTVIGPWRLVHLPLVFLFFLAIVALWTYLERRAKQLPMRLTWRLALEVTAQALIPAVIAFFLVNRVGPLQVRSYGIMMLLSFGAALLWMYLDRARYGFSGAQTLQAGILGFAGGILGGRLGFVLLNWGDYAGRLPSALDLWSGGMSWHGGLAGGLLVLLLGARALGVSFMRVLDLAAPGIAVGYAIARIGCFMNGCCYGGHCDLPWAVTFPPGSQTPPFPVHPAQLYSAAGTLLIVLPAILLTTRWLRQPFSRFLGFMVFSSIERIFIEFYRRGMTGEIFAPIPQLTVAQFASIVIIIVAGAVIVIREWQGWTQRASD